MKKLILGMVFVFATGTIMNASTTTNDKEVKEESYCDALYYEVRDAVTLMSGSEYVGIAAAIAAENACMAEEIDILED
jgi:hypothetical protein